MKQKTATLVIAYLSCAVVILGAATLVQHGRTERYRRALQANYQHAFSELVTGMGALDTALQKSVYAASPAMAGPLCTEVFGKAQVCQMALGVLPFSTQELEQTSGFISRVGDYASVLSRSAAAGTGLDEQQVKNLKSLASTAGLLAENLRALQQELSDGYLTMDEAAAGERRLRNVAASVADSSGTGTLGGSMKLVEQEFPEIPSLIYDGPFSEHLTNAAPKLIENDPDVSEADARQLAARFLGVQPDTLTMTARSEGQLPCWWFSAPDGKDTMSLALTVAGGQPLNLLSSRQPAASALSAEDATGIAKRFLSSRGYRNMRETYHMTQGNIVTVNFAAEQDGVLCYSDLIKVGVACDTGAICSFEARGYINSHTARDLPEPSVTADEARTQVTQDLEILSEQLTLIPTAGQDERLCWEFKCRTDDERHVLVYVNAVTGQQEKILLLLEDENGTLTL